MRSARIIISGGGTGGHIFPAIAIADAIKAAEPNSEFLFVGAKGRMEMERVPKAGYAIEGLWISGIQRKLTLDNLSFPVKLMSSLLRARAILKKFKPDVAVGVGGYASGPMLKVASTRKIPSLIQEQNSFPGITNRLLAKNVDTICVAYKGMEKWFPKNKIVMTGNPVRQEVVQLAGKESEGLKNFGLKEGIPTLLVVGGSLGARTINETIHANLSFFKSNGYQLIWQTGKHYAEVANRAVSDLDYSGVVTLPFIDRMDLAYAAADALVSRAGAMSVSEICLIQKAAVLVPSPNVAEDHQTKNAKALADNNAAVMVTDRNAQAELIPAVSKLLSNKEYREEIARNTAEHAFQNSAENIAKEVLKLISRN